MPGTQQTSSVWSPLWWCGPYIAQAGAISHWMVMSMWTILWDPKGHTHSLCPLGAPRLCTKHRKETGNCMRQGDRAASVVSPSLRLSYPRSQNIKWKIKKKIKNPHILNYMPVWVMRWDLAVLFIPGCKLFQYVMFPSCICYLPVSLGISTVYTGFILLWFQDSLGISKPGPMNKGVLVQS